MARISHFARSTLACLALLAGLQTAPTADARGARGVQTAPAPAAFQGTARVTGIADSDTILVEIDWQPVRLRLAQIDAPEKAQPFGRRSEQSLRELVGKRDVQLSWRALDRYGRRIAQISVDGLDVNAEQVRRGFAWVYRKHSNDAALIRLEQQAQADRVGLWADAHPIPPWEWRASKREP